MLKYLRTDAEPNRLKTVKPETPVQTLNLNRRERDLLERLRTKLASPAPLSGQVYPSRF
jgi:hypothetical protein